MARTKLIAKYAALDTPDLSERIHKVISEYIAANGIEELPYLEVNGRWTGTLSISDGGWRGDFDFLYPVLSMCRVDRRGNVLADMEKIDKRVATGENRFILPMMMTNTSECAMTHSSTPAILKMMPTTSIQLPIKASLIRF